MWSMLCKRHLIALVSIGAFGAGTAASANPPTQPDIAACSQEAAAVSGHDATPHREAKNAGGASTPDTPTDTHQSHSPSAMTGPASGSEATGDAAAREAFAACLAKHGYYKGYYH